MRIYTRIFLLVLLSGFSVLWSCKLMRESEVDLVEKVPPKISSEKSDFNKETAGELLRQSTEFQGWAILILGGVIAILITQKVHSNSSPEWTFILLGPSMIFLSCSFLAAWELKKRHNYLLKKNDFDEVMSLAKYLQAQFELFGWAIGALTVFAACFLCLILLGRVKPDEKEK